MKTQADIAQREWDEAIMEDRQIPPSPYACDYCLDYGENDGEDCDCGADRVRQG